MRFMRGSKVEILSKKEVATGAWICVEIISGNGRTYSVKYGDVVVEKVPRKAMRPCPPPVEGAHNWVRGDLVEVYHNVSWKTATIMKVIGGSSFLVRLLGMLQEFSVQGSHLRLRQSWEDGKWFVIGKGSGNCIMPKSKNQTYTRMESCAGDVRYPIGKDIGTLEPKMIFSRKRGLLLNSSHVDAYSKAVHKMRAVEKSDSSLQILPGHPSTFPEKVDAFVSPHKILGEKYMHASFDTGTSTRYSEIDGDSRKPNGFSNIFVSGTIIPSDTDSSVSSVASCSVNDNGLCYLSSRCLVKHNKDIESHCSDAESFCGWDYEDEGCSHSTNEELLAEVHRSELNAYRRTIESLYASGPLSWEEAEKVTNLRHVLHISDDEHLMEIKNLIASDSRLNFR